MAFYRKRFLNNTLNCFEQQKIFLSNLILEFVKSQINFYIIYLGGTIMNTGKVISFINMKGGVGKTTLCIGIGEFLAHYKSKKILFIDLDPQFNTTQSLMNYYDLEERYMDEFSKNNNTICKIFESPTQVSVQPKLPSLSEVLVRLDDYIDIIPGSINLIFEDKNRSSSINRRVKKFINDNSLKQKYDFIFIDCPATISLYTDAALIASDYYVVPNKVDRYSILGIKLLDQVIRRLSFDEELDIKPLGIIYTMLDYNITQKTKQIIGTFEKSDIVKVMGIFNSSTHLVRDLMVGLKGNISSVYSKSRNDIEQVANELCRRISNDLSK